MREADVVYQLLDQALSTTGVITAGSPESRTSSRTMRSLRVNSIGVGSDGSAGCDFVSIGRERFYNGRARMSRGTNCYDEVLNSFGRTSMPVSRVPAVVLTILIAAIPAACGRDVRSDTAGASLPAPPDVAAPPAGSLKTTSGLSTLVLQSGKGTRHPRPSDRVTVHYSGWTTDGKMFDSSVTRGQPSSFAVNEVVAGWTEGLRLMVEGEKRRFWIPESLAYKGQSGAPQGMLVFDVELIRIE